MITQKNDCGIKILVNHYLSHRRTLKTLHSAGSNSKSVTSAEITAIKARMLKRETPTLFTGMKQRNTDIRIKVVKTIA